MKRVKKWLLGIFAALSLSCIGWVCASCSSDINASNTESSASSSSINDENSSSTNGV
jgi:hypothetical protein